MKAKPARVEEDAAPLRCKPRSVPVLLVVEDDPPTLRVLGQLLAGQGFTIVEAADDARARAAIEEHRIDGALVDQHLPDASGLAVLEAVRARHPGAARALMTGDLIGDFVNPAGRLGARPYRKPFHVAELAAFLDEARRSLRERRSSVDLLSPLTPFSPRERECLERALAHRRRQDIATDLGIGVATVKTHIEGALDKLSVRSVREAQEMLRALLDEETRA